MYRLNNIYLENTKKYKQSTLIIKQSIGQGKITGLGGFSTASLHNTMKKYIIASVLFFLADTCHSSEWIPVGQQPNLEETSLLEVKLWKFLKSKRKTKFEAKESYRFQYQYMSKSIVFINAICLPSPKPNSDPGAFPGPTTETLKKEIYEVMDGGSCFFNVEYNIESGAFTSLSVNGEA